MVEKKSTFKFIHTADLHLGRNISVGDKTSQNRSSRYFSIENGDVRERALKSPVTALNNLVSEAMLNEVDFIVIAGDIFDKHTNTGDLYKVFKKKLDELSRNNIRVYLTLGNHDRTDYKLGELDLLTEFKNKKLPKGIYVFDDKKPESFEDPICKVVIHGQSFEKQHVTQDLVKNFPKKKENFFNIGLLHTDCYGSTSENDDGYTYAPTSEESLAPLKYDYWALGHIHLRSKPIPSMPNVFYSGNPQGLNTKEQNEKGCILISIDKGKVEDFFLETDDARFLEIVIPVTKKSTWEEFCTKLNDKCSKIEFENSRNLNLIKLTVTGNNTEISKYLASTIETKNLIRVLRSDILQIIQIDTNTLEDVEIDTDYKTVESLLKKLEHFNNEELTEHIFSEASTVIEKEFPKSFKAGNKIIFLSETTIRNVIDSQTGDILNTARTVAENILNGIPHEGSS